ncbi:putative phosphoribosylaminoimidazole carboxylase [Lyophyllum shimeji]|uniref:Phosphoribosylaminoimidazole carboxylase n=1 Tax=Lyophyllum shimeji TaxID=47721 RepID=A0A9P3UUM7_LYOSH|nr:putative phosphoribosylaminoimidazole carboxylase [Lyophyllum shimeji]
MLAASASLFNVKVVILDVGESAPAKQVIAPISPTHVDGTFADPPKIRELADKADVLTVEIEHVDVGALEAVQNVPRPTLLAIHLSPATIHTIQDKFRQKEHLSSRGYPISDFPPFEPNEESKRAAAHSEHKVAWLRRCRIFVGERNTISKVLQTDLGAQVIKT